MAASIARDSVGLGLRPTHVDALRDSPHAPAFLEVITENLLAAPIAQDKARRAAAGRPVVAHGVSLDLLGTRPLDDALLDATAALARAWDMPWVSEHLCWSAHADAHHHDLLPVPHTEEVVAWAVWRIREVTRRLPVPFAVENVSTYVRFRADTLSEAAFLTRVVEGADCGLLLDINNLYVNAVNHGHDPVDALAHLPWDRVTAVHIAGHTRRADGLLHDTHDRPVAPEVWSLYAAAWRRGGPFPTILEWDDDIPDLATALDTLATAQAVRR